MKFHSEKILLADGSVGNINGWHYNERVCTVYAKSGFSLVEAVTALIILALISSSVLVVVNRCLTSTADLSLRMQAFEVARENMEALLSEDLLEEKVEYGSSNKYPAITWQTTVEAFYDSVTELVWVQGTCRAEYTDASGQIQSVEMTQWLTGVTKMQMIEFLRQQRTEEALLADRIINTLEEAAEYAGVDVETFRRWIDNGLLTTEDGFFPKDNIDIFKQSDGNPSPEDKSKQVESPEDIIKPPGAKSDEQETNDWPDEIEPVTGLPWSEFPKLTVPEVWELIK